MNEYYNKHYITLDANNLVIGGFSDAFRQPHDGDICINDKGGYQFRLIIDGKLTEENPLLFDDAIPIYKWTGSEVVRRTDAEIEADRAAIVAEQKRAERIAARLYEPGEYIVLHGTLYRVTLPIPAGSAIAPGANCEATSIVGEFQKMNQ